MGEMLLLFIVLALFPVLWVYGEVVSKRWARIAGGLGTILIALLVVWISQLTSEYQSNMWYSLATKNLLEESLGRLEAGDVDTVTQVWRELNGSFQAGYENRGRYDELVYRAVEQLTEADHEDL